MKDKKIKVEFHFTDEFGQKSKLKSTICETNIDENYSHIDLLFEHFENFLLGAGFAEKSIDNKIKKVENIREIPDEDGGF